MSYVAPGDLSPPVLLRCLGVRCLLRVILDAVSVSAIALLGGTTVVLMLMLRRESIKTMPCVLECLGSTRLSIYEPQKE
jgi:hypothetical protein